MGNMKGSGASGKVHAELVGLLGRSLHESWDLATRMCPSARSAVRAATQPLPRCTALYVLRGGMETQAHGTILYGFLTRTLMKYRIPHEDGSKAPCKEGTEIESGHVRIDMVADGGKLVQRKKVSNYPHHVGCGVTNILGRMTLSR